jgi:pimeloyl-ACP methyl ester carboxylesterase
MPTAIEFRRYPGQGGVFIAADVGGDPKAPAVVLMHGGGQTRHSWGNAMRELLAAGYHVINFDARGHGDSDWASDQDYSVQAFSADLQAILETLPSPAALVGASLGAATSLYTAGNVPGLASNLVLVDLVPRIEAQGAAKIRQFMRSRPEGFDSVEEAADAVAAFYSNRPRPADSSGLKRNLRRRDDGRLHWHWDPLFLAGPTRMEPPEMHRTLLDAASSVRIPTLLVRGLRSDIVSDAGIAELRERLPTLEVYDVADAGHMVAGDKNDAFNQGVIAFLKRHASRV